MNKLGLLAKSTLGWGGISADVYRPSSWTLLNGVNTDRGTMIPSDSLNSPGSAESMASRFTPVVPKP